MSYQPDILSKEGLSSVMLLSVRASGNKKAIDQEEMSGKEFPYKY